MRRVLLTSLMSLGLMSVVTAKPDVVVMVDTIKQLYTEALNEDIPYDLKKYVSPELKALLDKDSEAAEKRGEVGCVDYDVVMQAQDFQADELKKSLSFQALTNKVLVNFTNFGEEQELIYIMSFDGKRYLVGDIIQTDGSSFKNTLQQCERESHNT